MEQLMGSAYVFGAWAWLLSVVIRLGVQAMLRPSVTDDQADTGVAS